MNSLEPAEYPNQLIGYSRLRTDLSGGRAANTYTMRACMVKGDGTGHTLLAEHLAAGPEAWTQFAGWSPDGAQAILLSGWESAANAAWEEAHQQFRFSVEGWRVDCWLVDLESGATANLTAIERVSFYNTGLFFWPRDPQRLGFQALIEGESHPFSMKVDGTQKQDLSQQSGFAYGFSASPDGQRIAYHQGYQVYLADADGRNAVRVETGNSFNFVPQWSPDGQWVEFLSGAHYHCHPHLVRRDNTGLRKLADRGGYEGVVRFLDVFDFHGGSSDVPAWAPDSRWLYYTARIGASVELMRVSVDGQVEQLTGSLPGVLNYHPQLSPDGQWVVFGSTRSGQRQLYAARADGAGAHPVTQVSPGWGAMWPHWQPVPRS